jgi:hypothetical protein
MTHEGGTVVVCPKDDQARQEEVAVVKPSIPEVLDLFVAYHRTHGAWGNLHIVLDDGNVSDTHVEWCQHHPYDVDDTEGIRLAGILRQMSKTQRLKLPRKVHEVEQQAASLLQNLQRRIPE